MLRGSIKQNINKVKTFGWSGEGGKAKLNFLTVATKQNINKVNHFGWSRERGKAKLNFLN